MSVILTGGKNVRSDPQWHSARYDSFATTSASITMMRKDWLGNETPEWIDETVMFYVYRRVSNDADIPSKESYRYYSKFCTPVIAAVMTKGSTTGQYVATYSFPGAGQYKYMAVPIGKEIVNMT